MIASQKLSQNVMTLKELEGKTSTKLKQLLWCWQGRRSNCLNWKLQARSRFERSFTIPRFGPLVDACLATGVHYTDTANYEAEDFTEDPEWRVLSMRNAAKRFTAYFLITHGNGLAQETAARLDCSTWIWFGSRGNQRSPMHSKHYFWRNPLYRHFLDCNVVTTYYPFATNP